MPGFLAVCRRKGGVKSSAIPHFTAPPQKSHKKGHKNRNYNSSTIPDKIRNSCLHNHSHLVNFMSESLIFLKKVFSYTFLFGNLKFRRVLKNNCKIWRREFCRLELFFIRKSLSVGFLSENYPRTACTTQWAEAHFCLFPSSLTIFFVMVTTNGHNNLVATPNKLHQFNYGEQSGIARFFFIGTQSQKYCYQRCSALLWF